METVIWLHKSKPEAVGTIGANMISLFVPVSTLEVMWNESPMRDEQDCDWNLYEMQFWKVQFSELSPPSAQNPMQKNFVRHMFSIIEDLHIQQDIIVKSLIYHTSQS